MPENMKEIKVAFSPSDIATLNAEACRLGISRAQLIRDRAIANTHNSSFDRGSYLRAVEAAARTVPGLPRSQYEHLAAKVITSIANQQ